MDLNNLKGLGPKTITLLNKLDINSLEQLSEYYPFRYEIIKKSNIELLNQDDKIIIDGLIENNPSVFYINRKLDKMSFRISDNNKIYNIVIYNRGFLKNKLKVAMPITIIGKYDLKHNTIIATDIRFGYLPNVPIIEPVYHLTYGLSGNQLKNFINRSLENYKGITFIPNSLKQKYNFIEKTEAVKCVHNPVDINKLKSSLELLKYEELFSYMLKMNYIKNNKKTRIGLERNVSYGQVEKFINSLPFKLTEDQLKSVQDIYHDLNSSDRMNRLLQGDVGSGKTIVSIIAFYINYLSGYQGALMAPTEILAIQHYNTIKNYFKNYNIKVELLTGKMKVSEKKKICQKLVDKDIDILVGTHAIISEGVNYGNLGLVVTDEQHRFGVNQRSNLKNKGLTPDILYMSATPIPRTYALTLYGDMEISNIKSMPNGRKSIITTLKKDNEIKEVLEMMLRELKNGHQIYAIAPLIEDSEKIDLENVLSLYEKMNKAFGKYFRVGLLHGKMSNKEKDEVMDQFKNNEIQILISTTVIEVGIDVANATMMVIFDSYRFGLSTIHQLRGRVGRNDLQSYCILVSNRDTERLNIMVKTNDGFKISEEDFKLRGSGDIFGVKQSGDMRFKIADLKYDFSLLTEIKKDVEEIVKNSEFIKSKEYEMIINSINQTD